MGRAHMGDIQVPPWRDKQRVKDELFGPGYTAIEVMPPREELIDEADMYHIWVLPAGFLLPFTIGKRDADPPGKP